MDKEIWENTSKGRAAINIFDVQGNVVQKLIRHGQKIQLTPQEREMNQEMCVADDLDLFQNGVMVPVRLIDDSEDAEEIASNPNLKSETDLRRMFKLHWKTFEKEVGKMANSSILHRLWEMAQDDDEGIATVRQANVVKARLRELDPNVILEDSHVPQFSSDEPSKIKPVTPR